MLTKEQEIELAWTEHRTGKKPWIELYYGNKMVVRNTLSEQQNHRCCYCGCRFETEGSKIATIEHVLPKSLGGGNQIDNLVVACWDCNNKRGNEMNWVDSGLG